MASRFHKCIQQTQALLLALCLGFVCLSACGSQQFDGRTYRHGDMAFGVGPPPAGWRRIEVSDALIAYRDEDRGATVAVNGRCHRDGEDVPLESLTQHLFIHFTERQVVEQKRIEMDGREAMRTELLAKLDGVKRGFVVYVLKKDSCVYDFFYVSEPGLLKQGMHDFDKYVAGFRTIAH
ncbi:MAG: hypothetical protein CSA75_02790 [Sorangium cellulosum]|nr:MAG: hypothetical protein CSA75_02790 [Sorangium cellulosum]